MIGINFFKKASALLPRSKFEYALWTLLIVIVIVISCRFIDQYGFNLSILWEKLFDRNSFINIIDIIVFGAAFLTLVFWARRVDSMEKQTKHAERNVELQEEGNLDQQFVEAMKLFAENNDSNIKIGAISVLESLAINSQKHTQRCIDFLCDLNGSETNKKLLSRIRDAIGVIVGAAASNGMQLNLSGKNLSTVRLSNIEAGDNFRFVNSNFSNSTFTNVVFRNINFTFANFPNVAMNNVLFYKCSFTAAFFTYNSLSQKQANSLTLMTVKFDSCDMGNADFSIQKPAQRFWRVVFDVSFPNSNLKNVRLSSFDVDQVDFSSASDISKTKKNKVTHKEFPDGYIIDHAKNNHKCILSIKQKEEMGELYKNNPEPESKKETTKLLKKIKTILQRMAGRLF